MSVDLAEWYAARLDEAEAKARAAMGATGGHWIVTDKGHIVRLADVPGKGPVAGGLYDLLKPAHAAYIADVDPAWRLADIAAKRAILAEHAPWQIGDDWVVCERCVDWTAGTYYGDEEDDDEPPRNQSRMDWPCATVRQLGTEFADSDGYQESWRP